MLDISRTGLDSTNNGSTKCIESASAGGTSGTNGTSTGSTTSGSGGNNVRKYGTNRPPSTEELREYAHRLCRDYLHGTWLTIQPNEMTFKKVSGGLSNLLYYCALPDRVETTGTEPRRLLLRLYGNVNSERAIENLITESVIFALLSETQRGPRLYGVFSGGRLEEFIEARPLKTYELTDSTMSALIADKMAQIHLMDVPINKQPKWLWQTMQRWIKQIETLMSSGGGHITQLSDDMMNSIKQLDLSNEFIWLKDYLMSIKSPVVFCHNDLQEGNILLRDGTTYDDDCKNNNDDDDDDGGDGGGGADGGGGNHTMGTTTVTSTKLLPNQLITSDRLVIIDFEYCSYNYRGFDFANHFCEWTYDYSKQDAPYFWNIQKNRPNVEQKEHFIRNYLKSLSNYPEYKPRDIDNFVNILQEIEAFTLASHFFWALWSVINATTSEITFDYWSYGKSRFKDYYAHKGEIMNNMRTEPNY